MAKRVVLGGLVGGLLVFFLGAVVHMATPLGMMGISMFPADKEDAALATLKGSVSKGGLYFFPGRPVDHMLSDSEMKTWESKLKAGPSGLLIIQPGGGEAMSPAQLLTELGIDVAGALLGSLLLATTRLNYAGRVGFLMALGVFGWLSISGSFWNWYSFPADFTIAGLAEELITWGGSGLVIAAIVKPAKAAEATAGV